MHILLDVDGVLLHTYANNGPKRWDRQIEEAFNINTAHFDNLFWNGPWKAVVRGKACLLEALTQHFQTTGELQHVNVHAFVAFWMAHTQRAVDARMLPILQQLSAHPHVQLHLATNQEHTRAQHLWYAAGLKAYCKTLFYSGAIGYAKPEAQYYAHIESALGLTPSTMAQPPIFFDDTPKNVHAAIARGWQAHMFSGPESLQQNKAVAALLK